MSFFYFKNIVTYKTRCYSFHSAEIILMHLPVRWVSMGLACWPRYAATDFVNFQYLRIVSMPIYHNLNDFDLVALIKKDDHDAYREIYYRYTGILYTHAYSKLQDREEAKDVVHDVFSYLWSKRGTIEFQINISGYLYQSLRNKILNIIAHKKIESEYAGSLQTFLDHGKADTDQLTRVNQLKAIIESEMANMPAKMREIFELSRKKHLSHREIAQELGISEKTVKNQVNNALKILRIKLGIFNYLIFLLF